MSGDNEIEKIPKGFSVLRAANWVLNGIFNSFGDAPDKKDIKGKINDIQEENSACGRSVDEEQADLDKLNEIVDELNLS